MVLIHWIYIVVSTCRHAYLTEYTIVISCRSHSNLHEALLESKKAPIIAA